MSTFLAFDHTDHKRWWVLRKGDLAVSLTAVLIPAGTPPLIGEVRDRDGGRLLPDCFTFHRPGTAYPDCPALTGGCDGEGEAISGARELLAHWVATGHDDALIARALAKMLRQEAARCENCAPGYDCASGIYTPPEVIR